ncbi:MAG TPA: O-antigen ligase family protein [Ktedonobacterales bacterium]|nr:O-antigen ligase family protein [Ktedonobacterales bacterium]
MSASAGRIAAARGSVTPERAARALLYITPLAVGFGQALTLNVMGLRASLTDVIVGALAALGAYALWRARETGQLDIRPALRETRQTQPEALALLAALLAYLLVIILSIVTAYTRTPVIKEALKWGEVVVVACAAWGFIRTERQLIWLAWGVIAGGLAEALLGCAQEIFASGLLGPGGSSVRVFGTFDQPNPYGGYLNLSLPVALALALFGRDPRMRWVAGGSSMLLLFALYLANSRGALLGLVAAVIVIVAVGWRLERQAAILAAIGAPLVAIAWVTHLIPLSVQDKLLAQFRINDVSLTAQVNDANFSTIERLAHWVAGLRMFAAHPILGVGAGNYSAAYQHYKIPGWDESLTHAHNYYINVAAETGALGLLAFLALVCAALYLGWRATRATDRQRGGRGGLTGVDARALSIGFAAVIIALCIHNVTDNLFVHAMELQFGLTLGALLRLSTPAPPKLLRLGVAPATTPLPAPDAGP